MTEERKGAVRNRLQTTSWTLLSWLGLFLHNRAEFPNAPLVGPETLFPSLISLALLLGWWRAQAGRARWALLLLGWAGIHFVIGGLLSVLPLPIWPFAPEQSLAHYLSHLLYGALQLPLLWHLRAAARMDLKAIKMRAKSLHGKIDL